MCAKKPIPGCRPKTMMAPNVYTYVLDLSHHVARLIPRSCQSISFFSTYFFLLLIPLHKARSRERDMESPPPPTMSSPRS